MKEPISNTILQPTVADMAPEEFRRHGYTMIDWITDFLTKVKNLPVSPDVRPGDIARLLPNASPPNGEAMAEILADIDRVLMPGMVHWNHPRFFGYFTTSGSGPGILGELLTAALNVNSMLWQACPSATELEQVTLDWLRQIVHLPDTFTGIMYDGGSTATLHAIAAARERLRNLNIREEGLAGRDELPKLCLYTSEHGHSSIDKAAVVLGLGLNNVHRVAVDNEYCIIPEALEDAINSDRSAGKLPFCVVATAGTTSCTSIDPIDAIADVCDRERLWLHVDGAHGGTAAVVAEIRHILDGWERADSIVINPHKWLFVPLDLSVLFTRNLELLARAFRVVPEYLRTDQGTEVTNYMDYGIPLGRRFRAIKLWFTLRYFGVEGIAEKIREHIGLAREFAGWIDNHDQFERLAPVPLSTICFRAHWPRTCGDDVLNHFNERLFKSINRTGNIFLSQTKLSDRFALRLVVSHVQTERNDLVCAWETIQAEFEDLKHKYPLGV